VPRRIPMFRPRGASDNLPKRRPPDDRPSSTARGYGSAAWQRVRLAVIARDQGACQLCDLLCWAPGEGHVDHVNPKPPGEPAEATPMEGLRLLCRKCHSKHGLKWTGHLGAESSEGDPDA
jgi:5-methylcytosine-specific restriction endonuclease McrA